MRVFFLFICVSLSPSVYAIDYYHYLAYTNVHSEIEGLPLKDLFALEEEQYKKDKRKLHLAMRKVAISLQDVEKPNSKDFFFKSINLYGIQAGLITIAGSTLMLITSHDNLAILAISSGVGLLGLSFHDFKPQLEIDLKNKKERLSTEQYYLKSISHLNKENISKIKKVTSVKNYKILKQLLDLEKKIGFIRHKHFDNTVDQKFPTSKKSLWASVAAASAIGAYTVSTIGIESDIHTLVSSVLAMAALYLPAKRVFFKKIAETIRTKQLENLSKRKSILETKYEKSTNGKTKTCKSTFTSTST